jgi:hypothetical protein
VLFLRQGKGSPVVHYGLIDRPQHLERATEVEMERGFAGL